MQHRQNYAQDEQISIRGFGARATFGALGVKGALRRDERNRVQGADQYIQLDLRIAARWSWLAGVRHSKVRFQSDDRYITAANPDDLGKVSYSDTTPVAGVMFHAGDTGLALDLVPARSRNMELGVKWQSSWAVSLDAALFRADTDDELATARNSGGRSSFQNVARARREGIELGMQAQLAQAWHLRLAYTRVDAQFRSPFLTCTGVPCLLPNTPVAAGSPIPGVPRSQSFARLGFAQGPWRAALDVARTGTTVVNDIATQAAPAYTLAGIEASREFGALRVFARIDNMFDRAHIGAVIVNDGNGRFFEPGPGRQWQLGAQWTF